MNHSVKLAEFCAGLRFDQIPPDVTAKAKLCILDCFANMYGSRRLEAVRAVATYIRGLRERPRATAFGWPFRTSVMHAAFLNGVGAEAIEAQDGLRFGGNHPGAAVIPAALAVAEESGCDGKRIIEAVVAGYEAADRPAAAMHPWHTLSGFLPTGTCGTFGAAVAVAKIRGFDLPKTLNALGNAGYILPISMAEQLMCGCTIKIIQAGQAASAGITAATLADAGITGDPYVLEGTELNGGFTQITTKVAPKFERITDGLGEHFTMRDIYIKPYTSCRHTHGAIQATLELCGEHKLRARSVDRIDVFTYGIAELAVGRTITAADTFVSAQFSIPYCVTAALMDGEMGPAQLTEKKMKDQDVLEFLKKVTVRKDDELEKVYPEFTSTRVAITLKDGRTLEKTITIPKGDPRAPMGENEIIEKFIAFAGARDKKTVARFNDMIMTMETIGNFADALKRK
ncbi:MAG: MmgE/PrpD family protein [Deltaproteobacteria bacterium]|nr:MmgE/PrpD family protein [Deltaproteobacteria bacterium]